MPGGYSSHADHMSWVAADAAKRRQAVESELRAAFARFVETREVEVIVFAQMDVFDLSAAILAHPMVLKPLMAVSNIGARAVERDLQIQGLNTYRPRLGEAEAAAIAGYIKPFLPAYVEIPALSTLDRVAFVDKEIRRLKGNWEKKVVEALNRLGSGKFKKRKFTLRGERFELDAASPEQGPVRVAIDVKRIEARRDIHKRCDEIANKARSLKKLWRQAFFAAIIYYPFIEEHVNIQNRLASDDVDAVYFASESRSSVESALRMLLSRIQLTNERAT